LVSALDTPQDRVKPRSDLDDIKVLSAGIQGVLDLVDQRPFASVVVPIEGELEQAHLVDR
jgi:hypothetical protein